MMSIFELGVPQVVFWWVATLAVMAAGWVAFGGQHRNPQHDRELAWLVWHWFTGGPLEMVRTYPRSGGRPRRTVIRLGLAVARTTAALGFMAAVHVQSGAGAGLRPVATWSGGGVTVMSVGVLVVSGVAMEWSMWRHYTQPLHWAVATDAGWPLDLRWWQVRRYIKIRRRADGMDVFLSCGPTFKPLDENKAKVDGIVRAKLGLSSVNTSWKDEGLHRYLEYMRQKPIPAKVPFASVKELIETESTHSRVLLGLSRAGEEVWVDLDKKSPHVLISAGTGSGKTVALAGITAQLMWHGADVVVLDFKELSHIWLRDLAGVRYAREIHEIHDTAVWLGEEVGRRKRAWRHITLDDIEAGREPKFPRLVIVCEEWSSTMDELRDHWKDVRPKGGVPRSPAVKALAAVLNMGRVLHMNVLMVAQRAEANAVGSGSMRENFPCKILVDRYSKKTWDMLVPECTYVAGISHAGRAQTCLGSTATETQLLFITERQAQNWVIDKRGMKPRVPHVPQSADAVLPGETVRDSVDYGTPTVSLWEAAEDTGMGIVPMRYEGLKKAAQRGRAAGTFPEPTDGRYDARDLRRWANTRGTGGTNEGDGVDRVDTRERESAEDGIQGAWLQREPSRRDSDRDRFYAKVAPRNEAGCELWTGATNGDGYGYFKVDGKAVPVHRFAYTDQVAAIPAGLTVDHRIGPDEPCTSKLCTRGDHLQAVTNQRNVELRHQRDKAHQGASR